MTYVSNSVGISARHPAFAVFPGSRNQAALAAVIDCRASAPGSRPH